MPATVVDPECVASNLRKHDFRDAGNCGAWHRAGRPAVTWCALLRSRGTLGSAVLCRRHGVGRDGLELVVEAVATIFTCEGGDGTCQRQFRGCCVKVDGKKRCVCANLQCAIASN